MQSGKLIMAVGALIFLGGLIWYFFGDKLHWIGRLPGDIRIERGNLTCVIALGTSILLSVALTVILNLMARILKK